MNKINGILKGIIFGSIMGLVFGIIEFATVGFDISIYAFSGVLSLVAYIVLLIILVRSEAQKNQGFGRRVLVGFVFSLALGLVYGIIAGIAGFVFADLIAKSTSDGVGFLQDFGVSQSVVSDIDLSPTPFANFFGEVFGALTFNSFFGILFSLAAAGIFRPKEKTQPSVAVSTASTQPAVTTQSSEVSKVSDVPEKLEMTPAAEPVVTTEPVVTAEPTQVTVISETVEKPENTEPTIIT